MSNISLEGNASGTGTFTIAAPNTSSNFTLTLPQASGTVVVTGGAQTIEFAAGSASTPSITTTGDTNTGIFFPAADTIAFTEGGTEAMRIDSSGNVGIGVTSITASTALQVNTGGKNLGIAVGSSTTPIAGFNYYSGNSPNRFGMVSGIDGLLFQTGSVDIGSSTERARIDSSGRFLVGTTNTAPVTSNNFGVTIGSDGNGNAAAGVIQASANAGSALQVNRGGDDGNLVLFYQAGTNEGSISVSGNTVSYNGGNLSRWAQLTTPKDDTPLFKGTVMSNLDEMNVYTKDGEPVENEQLNKVKVSDVEGDVNVAGVFVNWTYDDAHQVDEINMAMTGDMIIRIAQGVVVQKGDLLMSAGDGTAKPQDDDIVRSKTVAKVTSNHVTCTYADGSYCVPCVLMAC